MKKILVSDLKLIQEQINEFEGYSEDIQKTIISKLTYLKDNILKYKEEYIFGHFEIVSEEYQKVRVLAKQKLDIDMEKLFEE